MRNYYKYFFIFLVIFIVKVSVFNEFPFLETPDSLTYKTVAYNIFENQCVSRSVPETKECYPDWGGNQLFGYPLFLAAVSVLGVEDYYPVIFQYIMLSISIFYFCYIAHTRLNITFKNTIIISVILSVSPLTIGWSRSILTESIVIPLIIIIFTEAIKSYCDKNINIFNWFIILSCSLFTRYDMVIFCVSIPILAFYIYPAKEGIKKTIIIALLVSLPLSLWIFRGVSYGLDFPPKPAMTKASLSYPAGIILWFKTWSYSSIDNPTFIWKVFGARYTSIVIAESAYSSANEKSKINININSLKEFDGKSIPLSLDNEFYKVATEKIKNDPLFFYLILPSKRILSMITDFTYSNNLPIILSEQEGIKVHNILSKNNGINKYIELFYSYPKNIIIRIIIAFYKVVIFFIYLYYVFKRNKLIPIHKLIIDLSLAFILSSLLFIVVFGVSTETRYILGSVLSMELTVLIIMLTDKGKIFSSNFYKT